MPTVRILNESSAADLAEKMGRLMAEGYKPYGQLTVTLHPPSPGQSGYSSYAMVMIKDEEPPR